MWLKGQLWLLKSILLTCFRKILPQRIETETINNFIVWLRKFIKINILCHLCKQFMYKTKYFFIYIKILSLLILNCHVITLLNFNMVFPWETQGKQLELRLQSLINFVYICNFPFRKLPPSETQLCYRSSFS